MTKTVGRERHDITFQCPLCGHWETMDIEDFPVDRIIDCDECDEELLIEVGEYKPFWGR